MWDWRSIATLATVCAMAATGSATAQQGAPPPAVLVQPAELKPLSAQLEFIGRAAAKDKVDLHARIKGFLGPRKFTDGDVVKQGQVVFTIEPEPFLAAVDQKVAQRDAARAALANADVQLARAAELLRTNTGTRAVFDQRTSEQLQAKAALEDAEAQLRDAQINLSYTEIRSPIDGRIGRAAVSPGNIVSPVSGMLATVVNDQPMRVLFPITQRELLEARRNSGSTGDQLVVQVRLADGSLYKEKGKIDFIDVTVDPKTDGQIVRAEFANADHALTDGQTLRVVIENEKAPTAVVIPEAAIAIDQAGAHVFVVNDKNVVEQRNIKKGTSREGLVAVSEGIKEGEKIIVQGQQRVRPGMTVSPSVAPTPGQ